MKSSAHLLRRRTSIILSISLFLILNGVIAYYVQSVWGLIITSFMMSMVELIYVNAYASTWVPRIARMPLHAVVLLALLIFIGKGLITSTSVFFTNTEIRLVVGWAIISGVFIMLLRWFTWHYHVVPISLRLQARGVARFLASTQQT